jgi:8-oxo-dGTP pyrophosphatase MutT (NUDIX family)
MKTAPLNPEHEVFEVGVKALIVKAHRLLLLKRHDYPVWEMPGGRIDKDETIEGTLLRELTEELPNAGSFIIRRIVHAQPTEFSLPNNRRLLLLFFEVSADVPYDVQFGQEHQEAAWVSEAQLDSFELQPQVLQAARLALTT